jgi:hypothetical protein
MDASGAHCPVVLSWEPLTLCRGPMKRWHVACVTHWAMVPKPLQREIYHHYSQKHKLEHLRALREAWKILNAPQPSREPVALPEPTVGQQAGMTLSAREQFLANLAEEADGDDTNT